ncbi:uncharacterized protein Eint_021355 [Encephalitozoon intestinalis ATCC 50506]|uniref:Uncharacterized protein n=1 Tax=Encephalitozoon intestinalis (strain ATCC 50506) TaxID=876142 RepID=W8P966_ENCIT|nr:uncharacterized protein Eint_021355 [Encephalitozoon intestinalis ATCC 50506]AHL30082.1 hypothetical protein Eint_021355 [Encephalitozoon intestinalis ATCC 50506]UTX44787.1 hypothetical protein GPK93_02g03070 [Encephalitozoon intestinalis]
MGGISEKLKGLKFMQRAERKNNGDGEVSFSTYFCKKGIFSYCSKQKIHDKEDEAQKKARN